MKRRNSFILSVCAALLTLVACATPQSPQPASPPPPAGPPEQPPDPPPPPRPATQVYFYPIKGQTTDQQSRDRYECYLWATKQSGFDPSLPQLAPHQRVEVVPMPPAGRDTVSGAITGAAIGAAVARPHNTGEGAIVGAVAGAVLGAASDNARTAEARKVQERYDRRSQEEAAKIEQQAANYRRAMTACLEGRGYTVQSAETPPAPPVPATASSGGSQE